MVNKVWFLLSVFILLAAVMSLTLPRTAFASDPNSEEEIAVVVVDGASLRGDESINMARSILALVASIKPERPLVFIDAERPAEVFGPVALADQSIDEFMASMDAELNSSATGAGGIFAALAEATTALGLERASVGSSVFLILGDRPGENFDALAARVTPIIDRMKDQGFNFHVVAMSDRNGDLIRFAEYLTWLSGGSVVSAESPETLPEVGSVLLSEERTSLMDVLNKSNLSDGDVLSVDLAIAPGTSEARVIVFKEDPHGSLRLIDSDGVQMPSGSVESPYVSSWVIETPLSGNWRLETGGISGTVTVWSEQINGITLSLKSDGPAPLGESLDIVARAMPLSTEALLFAHFTSPDGKTLTYRLRDDGIAPDAVAGDGYFAGSTAPLVESGDYEIVLDLAWQGLDYRITSQHALRVQPFPTLEIQRIGSTDLVPGERTLVATASVGVDGQPYPVLPSEVQWELSDISDDIRIVEILPRTLSSSGEGWVFDIYLTTDKPGISALTLRLDLDYVGMPYVYISETLVVSVPAPQTDHAPEPVKVEPPNLMFIPEETGFPLWTLLFPILLIIAIGAIGIRWLFTSAPKGYLYNDREERLIDFSTLRRRWISRVLSRNQIPGHSLDVPGFDGLTFVFRKDGVSIRARSTSTTVRVDSKPLSGEVNLGSRNWIGTGGKLYSFFITHPSFEQLSLSR